MCGGCLHELRGPSDETAQRWLKWACAASLIAVILLFVNAATGFLYMHSQVLLMNSFSWLGILGTSAVDAVHAAIAAAYLTALILSIRCMIANQYARRLFAAVALFSGVGLALMRGYWSLFRVASSWRLLDAGGAGGSSVGRLRIAVGYHANVIIEGAVMLVILCFVVKWLRRGAAEYDGPVGPVKMLRAATVLAFVYVSLGLIGNLVVFAVICVKLSVG